MAAFPGVPTIKETVPGFVVVTWFALVAPPKVPQAIVNKLHADINEALSDPDVMKRLGNLSAEVTTALARRDRGLLQGRGRDLAQRDQDGERQAGPMSVVPAAGTASADGIGRRAAGAL